MSEDQFVYAQTINGIFKQSFENEQWYQQYIKGSHL